MIIAHPMGLWTFCNYADAIAFCDDVGEAYDLNEIGMLKSRCTIIHIQAEE